VITFEISKPQVAVGGFRSDRVRWEDPGMTGENMHQLLDRGLRYRLVAGVHCGLGSVNGSNGFAAQEDRMKFWCVGGSIQRSDGKTDRTLGRVTAWLGIRIGCFSRYLKAGGEGESVRC